MKPTYAAGLAKHLLEQSGRPDIATVETFGEVGAVGFNWPPCGVKVSFTDGSAAFVSFARTSSMQGDDPNQPDEFSLADLRAK